MTEEKKSTFAVLSNVDVSEKIKEKNNDILIFFNNNLGLRLYKDAFVEGTWEDCKKKINSIIK